MKNDKEQQITTNNKQQQTMTNDKQQIITDTNVNDHPDRPASWK